MSRSAVRSKRRSSWAKAGPNIARVAEALVVEARAPDGIVEAVKLFTALAPPPDIVGWADAGSPTVVPPLGAE